MFKLPDGRDITANLCPGLQSEGHYHCSTAPVNVLNIFEILYNILCHQPLFLSLSEGDIGVKQLVQWSTVHGD